MRCAFYVSGSASRLRKLLAGPAAPVWGETRLVVSDSLRNQDLAPVLAARGIRFVCFEFAALSRGPGTAGPALSALLLQEFLADEIDYCFCFGDHLLQGELLVRYANRIVNFHPSLLPLFPGRKAIDQAVRAGAFLMGNTAHFIDASMDGGPVLMQSVIPASAFHAHGYDAILDAQLPMLHQIHRWLAAGRVVVSPAGVTITGTAPAGSAFFPALE